MASNYTLEQLVADRSRLKKAGITETELRRQLKRNGLAKREFKRQLREAKRNVPLELRAKVNWNDLGKDSAT